MLWDEKFWLDKVLEDIPMVLLVFQLESEKYILWNGPIQHGYVAEFYEINRMIL